MKKVLILFGGNSQEHEISCKSVNFIIENIDYDLFDVCLVGVDYDNKWYIVKKDEININWKNNIIKSVDNIIGFASEFDIVFPMIHGNTVEDGKLQGMFELFNIKYVGCNSYSSLVSYDKLLTKLILEKLNIPQVPYVIYNSNTKLDEITYPVIVKPCKCGSSIGISVANNKSELKKGIKSALKYDNNVIIEEFIKNNRELECAILEDKKKLIVSDVGEIVNNGKWYDYDSKYKNNTDTIISDIDKNIKSHIRTLSKTIFKILNCKGLSRIDFIYDTIKNKLYFNELNTIPGFTSISMYPILMNNIGINSRDLITKLLLID